MVEQSDLSKYGPLLPNQKITNVRRDPGQPDGAWVTINEGQDTWWIPDTVLK